jgi:Skp family chaperone for outer membrane proteins
MKTFRLFVASLFVATLVSVSAFAQAAPAAAPSKIAVINTYAFGDEKAGITKYMNAMNALDKEFQPAQTELQTMITKYQNLQADIKKLQNQPAAVPVNQTAFQAKVDEYSKLERDIKFKQEDAKARFGSRQTALLGPVMQDIGKAIQEFAKQRGYIMVLDAVKLEQAGLLLGIGDDKIDVTKDFITFYNARPAGTAATTPK